MGCFHADEGDYRCVPKAAKNTLTVFAQAIEPPSAREAIENNCVEIKKILWPQCTNTSRLTPQEVQHDVLSGYQKRVSILANSIEVVRAKPVATKGTYAQTPWDSVLDDYHLKGYTESTFRNRHGNVWNKWTSKASGNTLIWSKTNRGGHGEGFNCAADARPNFWGSCTRYDLSSGQVNGKVSVQIVNGTVIDRPV